jgi:hypothetical protein
VELVADIVGRMALELVLELKLRPESGLKLAQEKTMKLNNHEIRVLKMLNYLRTKTRTKKTYSKHRGHCSGRKYRLGCMG